MQSHSFDQLLRLFEGKKASLLKEAKHGLEKENLRVSLNKALSQKRHPEALGSALMHPNLTLDFSEAQIEFVTKAYPQVEEALKELGDLHQFVYQSLDSEMLWPHSSPCPLDEVNKIPLAYFGMTEKGYEKWLYRKGLSLRCGKKMQLLSGIHYNFSFEKSFWQHLYSELKVKEEIVDFISESYLSLSRNFLRFGWLSSYLFGATPAVDDTFMDEVEKPIKRLHKKTLYAPDGTSIRMSHLGYFSKIQNQLAISFNSLSEYRRDLAKAIETPHPFYEKIGLMKEGKKIQINENFLQIEAEHYSRIRPKAYSHINKRPIQALKEGIGYFEVRNIDINPFCPLGVEKELLYFKHLFFIYCLFKESPFVSSEGARLVCENQNKVALFGRKENLRLTCDLSLKQVTLKKWAMQILEEMAPIAALLDDKDKKYSKALLKQVKKVEDPNLTPSKQQLNILEGRKEEFSEFISQKADTYQALYQAKKLPRHTFSQMEKKAETSLKELSKKESESEDLLYGYEDMESSSQMLLREAYRQGIGVEILDRKENFVRLINHKKSVLVKQATQSNRDSLIGFLAMENKAVTQKILKENNLSVLSPNLYLCAKDAVKKYCCYQSKKIVVKPNSANFGEGIAFIEPRSRRAYIEAARRIEEMGDQILVEPFFEGEEYRFLVIGKRVVAVAQRVPAYVRGDDKHTIEELIEIKNRRIAHRSHFQKPLKLTKDVLDTLKEKGHQLTVVPQKNQKIFLRYNSNVSTGGESIDKTDEISSAYKNIALKACRVLGASICGVDMLIQNIKEKPSTKNHVILELNHNPALFIHRFPTSGEKRYVEKDLLKELFN